MHDMSEAPKSHIRSEVIAKNTATKVVRVLIPEGESLPTHPAKGHVTIAIVSGEGRINVAGRELAMEPGTIVEVETGEPHSVYADQAVELLVIQGH